MKIIRFIFAIFLLTGFTGLNYSQTSNITRGCNPTVVQFNAPSGVSSYFWDFGDGVTSLEENPTHIFSSEGEFNVIFKETADGSVIGTIAITIYPKPDLSIAADTTQGCAPFLVNFEGSSDLADGLNLVDYEWVFGDGITGNGSTVSHNYELTGSFDVSLTIHTDVPLCDVTEIDAGLIEVKQTPEASFITAPNPPVSCDAPFNVQFSNTTPNPADLTFEWDLGNGQTFSGFNPPVTTYDLGTFYVTLTATNNIGCTDTYEKLISVGAPQANFETPDSTCVGVPVTIENTSPQGTYLWELGPNASFTEPNGSISRNPTIIFSTKGNHDVTLTVTSPDGACQGDTTIQVYADQADATFEYEMEYGCTEPYTVTFTPVSTEAIAWSWTFSNGETADTEISEQLFYNEDTTTYSINGSIPFGALLSVTNPSGCTATFLAYDIIPFEPNALFQPDTMRGCAPLTVTFEDKSTPEGTLTTWEYDYGDGSTGTFTDDSPHTHTYDTPGEYGVTLIVTNESGCKDTSYVMTIMVGDVLTLDFSVDNTEVCQGDTVHFTDISDSDLIDAWHFETDEGRSSHCFNENELDYAFFTQTGTHDVTLYAEYNGCYSKVTKEDLIEVKGPIAQIDYEIDCSHTHDIMFRDSSKSTTSITWDFGDGTTSTDSNPVHHYDAVGDYTVILTANNDGTSCPASYDTTTVYVRDIEAVFEIDTIICQGEQIDLDGGNSEGVYAACHQGYTWLFSFRQPWTDEIPTKDTTTFGSPGAQTVSLIVSDINGCLDTLEKNVTVYSGTPTIAMNPDRICLPADVDFTGTGVADAPIVSWEWDFGDGQTGNTQNISHHYTSAPNPGNITVSLTITDSVGCPFTASALLPYYQPTSTISTNPAPAHICAGDDIVFSATDFTQEGSHLTYEWDFGNSQSDTSNPVAVTYENSGTYSVTLEVEEVSSGCRDTITTVVDVQDYPIADFTSSADDQDVICWVATIDFNDASTSAYDLTQYWDFGNGQVSVGSDPTASFNKGTFDIQLIVSTSYGCKDTLTKSIDVVGPEGDFTISNDAPCKNEDVTFGIIDTVDISSFIWDFGDGVSSNNESPVSHAYVNVPPDGQTIVKLILRGENDVCETVVEKPIAIHNTTANFEVDNACVGIVNFQNTSTLANVFHWDFGDGETSAGQHPQHNYSTADTYYVTLTAMDSDFGCRDTLVDTVQIYPVPPVSILGDTICQYENPVLQISSPMDSVNYNWSPGQLFITNNTATPNIVQLDSTTTFQVIGTSIHNCADTATFTVPVVPVLDAINIDTPLCVGQSFTFPVDKDEYHNFVWTPSEGLSCTDCAFPTVEITKAITYTLERHDIFGLGCRADPATFTINVEGGIIMSPNIFSPNGDQKNDYFKPFIDGNDEVELVIESLEIYNRWGEKVYEGKKDDIIGWDGRYKGQPAPVDNYFFKMRAAFSGCPAVEIKGDVTLIR